MTLQGKIVPASGNTKSNWNEFIGFGLFCERNLAAAFDEQVLFATIMKWNKWNETTQLVELAWNENLSSC